MPLSVSAPSVTFAIAYVVCCSMYLITWFTMLSFLSYPIIGPDKYGVDLLNQAAPALNCHQVFPVQLPDSLSPFCKDFYMSFILHRNPMYMMDLTLISDIPSATSYPFVLFH